MKTFFFLSTIFFSSVFYSQETLQSNQIYFDHNIAYRSYDVSILNAIVEFKDDKGIVNRRETYENGIMVKKIMYYTTNIAKGAEVPFQETVYSKRKLITKVSYTLSGEKYEYVEYDEKGFRKFSEYWKDGQHTTQYFRNGKLHGIAVIVDKFGDVTEEHYKDGTLLRVIKKYASDLQNDNHSDTAKHSGQDTQSAITPENV